MTVALFSGTLPAMAFEPTVVGRPRMSTRSLTAYGIPCRGPLLFPARISASARAACARARSAVTAMKEFSFGSSRSIRPSVWPTASTGESAPDSYISPSSAMLGVGAASIDTPQDKGSRSHGRGSRNPTARARCGHQSDRPITRHHVRVVAVRRCPSVFVYQYLAISLRTIYAGRGSVGSRLARPAVVGLRGL